MLRDVCKRHAIMLYVYLFKASRSAADRHAFSQDKPCSSNYSLLNITSQIVFDLPRGFTQCSVGWISTLFLPVYRGRVSLDDQTMSIVVFSGCFCTFSDLSSLEYLRTSLEQTLLSNLEQEDRLPFQVIEYSIIGFRKCIFKCLVGF